MITDAGTEVFMSCKYYVQGHRKHESVCVRMHMCAHINILLCSEMGWVVLTVCYVH